MSILVKIEEPIIIYKYKNKTYETVPIKNFYIEKEELIGNIKYISIRKRIPILIHLIIIITIITPNILINYNTIDLKSTQVRIHTMRVPSEMYYDIETKILDIDITNDSSNFETISFIIKDEKGNVLIQLNGINPGESIGSLPIEIEPEILPIKSTIIYKTINNGYVFNDIKQSVLIVDRLIADKDLNKDF